MTRVKRGFISKRKHKKIIKLNKGYRGSHSKLYKVTNEENMKSLRYSYFDRRKKKNNFKKLWIKKINIASKNYLNIKYSVFLNKLKLKKIILNRKILAKISEKDKETLNFII